MAVTTTEAIASTTAAGTSSDISVDAETSIQVWTDEPLRHGDTVAVYRTDDGGSEEAIVNDGAGDVVLKPGRPSVALTGPAVFRLKKSATAVAVAVLYDA